MATSLGAAAHIPLLIDLLRQDGVTFPGNKRMTFANLTARSGVLHAEGIPANDESEIKRVAVSFGPQHGAVSVQQVEQGLREVYLGGFDAVVFCGFAFGAPPKPAYSGRRQPPHLCPPEHRGRILNAENTGKSDDDLIAMWNEAHPDDPVD